MFRKNKVARRLGVTAMILSGLTIVFGVMGIIWPEAFYGCREIPYDSHCSPASPSCVTIDLASSTNCSFLALGWLTIIALVGAIECWLMALVWNWLGDQKKGAFRVLKIILTAISIYEIVVTPLVLLFHTVTIDELLEVFTKPVAEALFGVVAGLFLAGLILDVVWLVLLLAALVVALNNKKRV